MSLIPPLPPSLYICVFLQLNAPITLWWADSKIPKLKHILHSWLFNLFSNLIYQCSCMQAVTFSARRGGWGRWSGMRVALSAYAFMQQISLIFASPPGRAFSQLTALALCPAKSNYYEDTRAATTPRDNWYKPYIAIQNPRFAVSACTFTIKIKTNFLFRTKLFISILVFCRRWVHIWCWLFIFLYLYFVVHLINFSIFVYISENVS